MMKRHRSGAPPKEESSSDEGEDAFASLTRPQPSSAAKRAKGSDPAQKAEESVSIRLMATAPAAASSTTSFRSSSMESEQTAVKPTEASDASNQSQLPVATTSSMKRHHGVISNARKSKMDSMLQELASTLESTKNPREPLAFVPNKKGSYVDADEEDSTTNLFIGNLPTHVTEVQLGDLYSIKIMWPRPGDTVKNRHTGFVCFFRRDDAEAAMRALDDTDPFACGRRITLRWGKSIIREDVREGASDLPASRQQLGGHRSSEAATIHVRAPDDSLRERWISTVADFVARDGSALENALISRMGHDPRFDFLFPSGCDHAYYKWRVFSFCQGDHRGDRKAPFYMLEGGCLWVPPPLPTPPTTVNAPQRESSTREVKGGGSRRTDGRARLDASELAQAHQLFRVELCASRQSICRAMAFCFEKTAAAHHVASLLQGLFVTGEDSTAVAANTLAQRSNVSVETLISRLYLLSDILFNSQQPGIKHAFLYRSAIESMAPSVFAALGSYSRSQRTLGMRWTSHHKLATSVHVVLQAWTSWDVYPPAFLEELQARFEGREATITAEADRSSEDSHDEIDGKPELGATTEEEPIIREVAQGHWTAVDEEEPIVGDGSLNESNPVLPPADPVDRTQLVVDPDQGGEPLDEGPYGLRADVVASVSRRGTEAPMQVRNSGSDEPIKADDPDGEPIDEGDADGEPIADEDPDGEPIEDEDPDGDPIEKEDPDGEPLERNDPDGEPFEEEDPDGEPFDDRTD